MNSAPTPPACTTSLSARPSQIIADLGLTSAEINSGGFLPPPHLPIEQLRSSADAREEYLGEFSSPA